jgi:hypothetical protein
MKSFLKVLVLGLLFPARGHAQYACAGLDRVDIYLNNKLLGTSTFAEAPVFKLGFRNKNDTIVLHAFTNYDGLHNCTLDVKDEQGELMDHVNSTGNTGYEAVFTFVFNRSWIDDPDFTGFDIFLNLLCEKTVETERITTFAFKTE